MSYEHHPYNTEDNAKFVSQTTPSKTETLCKVTIPADYVIPIIFIPGIMGSNIRDQGTGQHVWYPPNGTKEGLAAANAGEQRDARTRQMELNPETTIVGQDGYIDEDDIKKIQGFDRAKALRRGWGSVWWQGYSKILIYLEKYLNHDLVKKNTTTDDLKDPDHFTGTKEWKKIVATGSNGFLGMGGDQAKLKDIKKDWDPIKKEIELLTKELHGKLANYSFPVFAIGYNWLQSNDLSAHYVAHKMQNDVKQQIKKEFPTQTFEKFIIVTHSMGGLVTRSLIQDDSVKNDILGVMHGVMPASGAPTVYQRICRGWEGSEVLQGFHPIDAYAANRGREVFGATSERLMPVLANAPGALQLLPFANFLQHPDQHGNQSKAWLTLRARNRNGDVVMASLPQNDPYGEIYTQTDTWWSMINMDFLDPAGILNAKMENDGKTDIISYYIDNIKLVSDFHKKIADSYHPNTYAHYGRDEKHLAYNEILWSTDQILPIDTAEDLINYKGYAKHGAKKEEVVEQQVEAAPPTEEEIARTITLEPIVVTAPAHKGFEHLFDQDSFRTIVDTDGNQVTFNIRIMPTSAGDGTVCAESGADVEQRNLKQVFVMRGLDHAASYDDKNVHRSTIYSIAKIFESLC
ncbi:hypothetical protein [Acinetobacter sp.]|uniref:esterase/lipase family protein n=1 Tax=Acinetobacter sp. TaxID=472 RepID=UPI00258814FA|nr:hypothetical protein [Acinetobacter sp.]